LIDLLARAALCRDAVNGASGWTRTASGDCRNPGGTQEVIMSRRLRLALLAAAGLVIAVPVLAQQPPTIKKEPIKPINDVAGAATFNAYCTVCHGPAGKGDGPAAKALAKPPADLTLISARNGGRFPAEAVKQTIVGENTPLAHGTRDMPMWGPLFRSTEGATVELRLKNLVDFIGSMQAK
jgi:mono/diheme cytochrome c family protein